ncbi:MAG: 1-acyl-sn-glycerol-3-phosphate acyltransferase [Chromatiaceae bacterium]|nr:1-acyl-sn-glycerol-3-phosphate acyltransferase [Chromatiaceae bacterium]MBP9604260.1 1-acyl-sn-glycerol-3-phosphate acyltransferase [Chromatiaceae bacterium]
MQSLLALWRGLRFLLHILTAALLVVIPVALPRTLGLRPTWIPALTRWWYRHLCRILGLRLEVTGGLAPGILLVANHISWLDIPVLGAQGDIAFLSKAEIRAWPLIGWMAEVLGTLFIHRGANQARDIADQIATRARAGQVVVIFPEATTADGTQLRPFHPRLFAAAQESGARLQPVALRYGKPNRLDPIAPFIGDDQPVPHLLRVLRHPGIRVQVQFLPPLASAGLDRKGMAEACRRAIGEALGLPREASRSGPSSPHRALGTIPVHP